MPRHPWITFALVLAWPAFSHSENLVKDVKQSVTRSTLDQPGTKPFHLKATIAPETAERWDRNHVPYLPAGQSIKMFQA